MFLCFLNRKLKRVLMEMINVLKCIHKKRGQMRDNLCFDKVIEYTMCNTANNIKC